MNDTYVCAQRLNLDNHLYEIGDEIAATAFNAETLKPETPEQCIERLRADGVLKLPLEVQQADDLQAQIAAMQAEMAAKEAELQALKATLPAAVAQRKAAGMRNPEQAPAASGESAPISE